MKRRTGTVAISSHLGVACEETTSLKDRKGWYKGTAQKKGFGGERDSLGRLAVMSIRACQPFRYPCLHMHGSRQVEISEASTWFRKPCPVPVCRNSKGEQAMTGEFVIDRAACTACLV